MVGSLNSLKDRLSYTWERPQFLINGPFSTRFLFGSLPSLCSDATDVYSRASFACQPSMLKLVDAGGDIT